jgi:SWI/SNF-related matrix-associated actin-dependent regulator 1 of chromatin subfamily A
LKHIAVSLPDCQVSHTKLRGPVKLWGLTEALKRLNPKSLIFDESHRLKNKDAARSKAAKALAKDVPVRFLLSGTPLLNRPEELAHQLDVLGHLEDLFGGWKPFTQKYCGGEDTRWGYQAKGHSRLEELNRVLRSHCFIRRRKAQVLQDLPAKQRARVEISIDNRREYREAELNFLEWLAKRKGDEAAMRASYAEHLARITHLKRLAVAGKLGGMKRWVHEFLEDSGDDEKLLVFAWHRDVIDAMSQEFGWLSIHGDTPNEVGARSSQLSRDAIAQKFQTDPTCRGLVLQIQAGGEGLDLTAASNVAFLELPWTPGALSQAEDRCYGRMSDLHGATAWYLVAGETIEEWILDLLAAKQEVVDAATDGRVSVSEGDVLRELVARLEAKSGDLDPGRRDAAPGAGKDEQARPRPRDEQRPAVPAARGPAQGGLF